MKKVKFSFKTMIFKGIKYFVLFGLPVLISGFGEYYPQWASLTIGGVLVMISNYLKIKVGVKLP